MVGQVEDQPKLILLRFRQVTEEGKAFEDERDDVLLDSCKLDIEACHVFG